MKDITDITDMHKQFWAYDSEITVLTDEQDTRANIMSSNEYGK